MRNFSHYAFPPEIDDYQFNEFILIKLKSSSYFPPSHSEVFGAHESGTASIWKGRKKRKAEEILLWPRNVLSPNYLITSTQYFANRNHIETGNLMSSLFLSLPFPLVLARRNIFCLAAEDGSQMVIPACCKISGISFSTALSQFRMNRHSHSNPRTLERPIWVLSVHRQKNG